MSDFQINLICCTQVLVNEVARPELTQNDIALTYAMALKSAMQGADKPDWRAINTAILGRWKMSGLERIKMRAMKIASGKIQP